MPAIPPPPFPAAPNSCLACLQKRKETVYACQYQFEKSPKVGYTLLLSQYIHVFPQGHARTVLSSFPYEVLFAVFIRLNEFPPTFTSLTSTCCSAGGHLITSHQAPTRCHSNDVTTPASNPLQSCIEASQPPSDRPSGKQAGQTQKQRRAEAWFQQTQSRSVFNQLVYFEQLADLLTACCMAPALLEPRKPPGGAAANCPAPSSKAGLGSCWLGTNICLCCTVVTCNIDNALQIIDIVLSESCLNGLCNRSQRKSSCHNWTQPV